MLVLFVWLMRLSCVHFWLHRLGSWNHVLVLPVVSFMCGMVLVYRLPSTGSGRCLLPLDLHSVHLSETAISSQADTVLWVCRDPDAIDSLDRYSMACPALPLCGLAIGEAERGLPDITNRIRALMNKLGFGPDEHFHIRMTGCPNGCTRPYMAELGFVGDGPNSYQLWLGGTAAQTRLAEPFMERMKVQVGF